MPQIMIQFKREKTTEITYLEANKQPSYHLRYLEHLKGEKTYEFYFEGQKTSWKQNVSFLQIINEEIRCGLCISSVNCNKIAMGDAFSS